MRIPSTSIAAVIGMLGLVRPADAGPILLSDFVSPAISTFDGLGVLPGQPGSGLDIQNRGPVTIDGNVFTTDNGVFRYFSHIHYFNDSGAIGSDTDRGFIDIVLGSPVTRAGIQVSASNGFVSFFDESDQLLGSMHAHQKSAPGLIAFAGWQATFGNIARIRIEDMETNGLVLVADNLVTETGPLVPEPPASVPEPSTLLLLSVGTLGLFTHRSSRRPASPRPTATRRARS